MGNIDLVVQYAQDNTAAFRKHAHCALAMNATLFPGTTHMRSPMHVKIILLHSRTSLMTFLHKVPEKIRSLL